MIDSIELVGFQDMMLCKTPLYSCIDSNIRFSYKFFAGHTYGLISDFGCGSWVVSEAVSGKTSETYLGKRRETMLGRLIANRELPILRKARLLLDEFIRGRKSNQAT